ncbi:hypothetical protein SFA32_12145 [Buttiauxella sp. HR94]|nr:hypothetical protein SFA32_12145 [Buttiauxella sp. HR94]
MDINQRIFKSKTSSNKGSVIQTQASTDDSLFMRMLDKHAETIVKSIRESQKKSK